MKRLQTRLQRQPWAFVYYGLGFGGLLYLGGRLHLTSAISVGAAVIEGVVFAVLMSVFLAIRRVRQQRTTAAEPPFRSSSDG